MYIANCLYMGSEVAIIAKTELVLDNLIASIIEVNLFHLIRLEEHICHIFHFSYFLLLVNLD